jgi:hypothetical protein
MRCAGIDARYLDWTLLTPAQEARWMARLWRPNAAIRDMVDVQRDLLGWDPATFDDRPRRSPSDIVIGAHVRGGDKCHESRNDKLSPLRFAKALLGHKVKTPETTIGCDETGRLPLDDRRAQAYFDAAAAEVNAILRPSTTSASMPDSETASWNGSKPTILVMSDDTEVLDAMRAHPASAPFALVHTVNSRNPKLKDGFNAKTFGAMKEADRVEVTRPMVRDMELLTRHAGGLTVRGPRLSLSDGR